MLRTVWDTNCLIPALANPKGNAGQCWERVVAKSIVSLVSNDTLAELERVTKNPHLQKNLKFDDGRAELFIESVRSQSTTIDDVPSIVSIPRDPSDESFLNLAITTLADFLVTEDRDLLTFPVDTVSKTLRILTAADFLKELRAMEAIALGYE